MKKIISILATIATLIFVICVIIYILMTPIFTRSINSEDIVYSNQESLRAHVEFLTDSTQDRSHENIERLNEVASYIYDDFRSSGCDSIEYQTFEVEGSEYKNVICEFSGESEELIVV
jgi:predicted PurR-regulated permease PerM